MTQDPHNLEDICDGEEWIVELKDINYCGLSYTRPVDCKYCVKHKDHNGLYQCRYDMKKIIYVVK